MKRRSLLLLLTAAMLATPLASHADTLDAIMKAGVLKVAVPQDFPPFGSVGSDMKPVGYDIDVADNKSLLGGSQTFALPMLVRTHQAGSAPKAHRQATMRALANAAQLLEGQTKNFCTATRVGSGASSGRKCPAGNASPRTSVATLAQSARG